jgi:ABC-type phosphate transport system permease subunit
MIYILGALLPPLGLLLNGQPFSAVLNLLIIIPCVIFGLLFPALFLVPSLHAVIAIHMKRQNRRHREVVQAIERHGPPPNGRTGL